MNERPKIKVKLSFLDKAIEIIDVLLLFFIWGIVLINYNQMPDIIPTHFDSNGEVDGAGFKTTIFILPIISTILYIGMTITNKYPHTFNYLSTITKENAESQYKIATRMIRYLKSVVLIIFGIITFKTIQFANGVGSGLGSWFLPLTLILTFIPVLYLIVKSYLKS